MLLTNQRLDKLAASCADFIDRGMLPHDQPLPLQDKGKVEEDDSGPVDGKWAMAHITLAQMQRTFFPPLTMVNLIYSSLHNVTILETLPAWQIASMKHPSHILSNNLSTTSSSHIPQVIVIQAAFPTPMKLKSHHLYLFFIQPLQLSMLLATHPVSMACSV
jgi:hypothetical protein